MRSDKCCLLKHSFNTSSERRMTKSSILHRNLKGWSTEHSHFTPFCFHYLQVSFYFVSHPACWHLQITANNHVLHTGLSDLIARVLGCWNVLFLSFLETHKNSVLILTKLCLEQLMDSGIQKVWYILSTFSTQPSVFKLSLLLIRF